MRNSLTTLLVLSTATMLMAQPPSRPTQPPAPVVDATPQPEDTATNMQEINVDGDCRIVVQDRGDATGRYSRPHLRPDSTICHLESIHDSRHDGVIQRTKVHVLEQTFVLHNVSPDPVSFVVHQPVKNGWHIDSEPKPDSVFDGVASFRVVAQPGEVIRLHVGQRR